MEEDYLPHTRISTYIDSTIKKFGDLVSYLWLVLLILIVLNVVRRYIFSEGSIELEEIQWHLYSIGFLAGLSFAYQADSHIRVDILRTYFSPELQAWIEIYGTILFLMPFVAFTLIYSVPFVQASWALAEVSPSPGGLPYRWLIKAALPLGFGFLLLCSFSRLHRVWFFLFSEESDFGNK